MAKANRPQLALTLRGEESARTCRHPKASVEEHQHDAWKDGALVSSKIVTVCMRCLTELSERKNPDPPTEE